MRIARFKVKRCWSRQVKTHAIWRILESTFLHREPASLNERTPQIDGAWSRRLEREVGRPLKARAFPLSTWDILTIFKVWKSDLISRSTSETSYYSAEDVARPTGHFFIGICVVMTVLVPSQGMNRNGTANPLSRFIIRACTTTGGCRGSTYTTDATQRPEIRANKHLGLFRGCWQFFCLWTL